MLFFHLWDHVIFLLWLLIWSIALIHFHILDLSCIAGINLPWEAGEDHWRVLGLDFKPPGKEQWGVYQSGWGGKEFSGWDITSTTAMRDETAFFEKYLKKFKYSKMARALSLRQEWQELRLRQRQGRAPGVCALCSGHRSFPWRWWISLWSWI